MMVRPMVVTGTAMVLTLMVVGRQAHAGALDKDQVSSEAKWLMFIDAEQLRDAPIYPALRTEHLDRHEKQDNGKFKEILGIGSWDQVESILLYGTSQRRGKGVLIFTAPSDQAAARKVLKEKPNYALKRVGEHDVYTWTYQAPRGQEKPHTVSMAFIPGNRIVMTRSLLEMDTALKVLDGKSPSLAKGGQLKAAAPAGCSIFMEAVGGMHANKHLAMLRQAEHMSISAVGGGEATTLTLEVAAPNTEVAAQMKDVLLGFKAMMMMRLSGAQEEDLQKMLEVFRIDVDDKTVNARWPMPNGQVIKMIKDRREGKHRQKDGGNGA